MKHLPIIIVLLCLFLAPPLQADTIFSTFGPGDSYNGAAYAIAEYQNIATPFVPSSNFWFDTAEVALSYFAGENSFDVSLMSDAGGLPGAIIESFSVTGVTSWPGDIYTVNSILHPLLMANTTYWLGVLPGITTLDGGWHLTDQPYNAIAWGALGSWSYFDENLTATAFRVSGTLIPEPASLLLLGTGLGILWLGVNRRKRK